MATCAWRRWPAKGASRGDRAAEASAAPLFFGQLRGSESPAKVRSPGGAGRGEVAGDGGQGWLRSGDPPGGGGRCLLPGGGVLFGVECVRPSVSVGGF